MMLNRGLAGLRQAELGRPQVCHKELNIRIEITYFSEYAGLIDDIHRWFDAQLADHGPDSKSRHSRGIMHQIHDINGAGS
ncbi:MAG: hypothetical protein LUQ57_02950 [Methylococcaceae bacterium]|nr:hypothetical protein [Methylococcaceae bacterium]